MTEKLDEHSYRRELRIIRKDLDHAFGYIRYQSKIIAKLKSQIHSLRVRQSQIKTVRTSKISPVSDIKAIELAIREKYGGM